MGVRGSVCPWGLLLHSETISLALWSWVWLLVVLFLSLSCIALMENGRTCCLHFKTEL